MKTHREPTYLDGIVTAHRETAAADVREIEELIDSARGQPEARGFRAALAAGHAVHVIAEVKRRSPSKGALAPYIDAAQVARSYVAGGASCISVLTDEDFFGGSERDLRDVRASVPVPVLRKDFTVSPLDVVDARIMGADCVLLIVAALDDAELSDLHALALEVGLDVLVEVHDEREVDRALAVGATLVGVNQRDLSTFQVDRARAVRVAPLLPEGVVRVAESGITGPDDVNALVDAGYHAVLVGEHLITSDDPCRAVSDLVTLRR